MLGWMVYVIAVTVLLGAGAYAAERSAQLRGASTRGLWGAAIVASLVLPTVISSVSIQIPRLSSAIGIAPPPELIPLRQITSRAMEPSAWLEAGPGRLASTPNMDAILKGAWIAASGSIFLAILITGAHLYLRKRSWERQEVAGANVYVSQDVGPAVVGLLRPSIVVPRWITHATPEAQALVLAHEQSHVDANDPQLLAIAILLIVTMPWNLPLWWQLRRLRFAIEMDCDARVLKSGNDVRSYGETLIMVGERQSASIVAVAAMSESRSFLEQRIRKMTAKQKRLAWASAAALACLGFVLVAGAAEVCPPNAANGIAVVQAPAIDTPVIVHDVQTGDAPMPIAGARSALHVVVNPHVLAAPTPAQMAGAYPREAARLGVGAMVRIRCAVLRTGDLTQCAVFQENPAGLGFGDAALKLAPDVKMTPRTIDGVPAEGTGAIITLKFVVPPTERHEFAVDPGVLDGYVGHYQMGQTELLVAVIRDGAHLSMHMTGQPAAPAFASSPTEFFSQALNARFDFVLDRAGHASSLVMHQNGRSIPMGRIDEGAAQQISLQLENKVKAQTPSLGTEGALRRLAGGILAGQPDYDEMTPTVAAHLRKVMPRMQPWLANYGPVEGVKFLGVGPMGADVFDMVQSQGITHWSIELGPDGKIANWHAKAGP